MRNFTYLLFCLLVVFSVNVSFGQSKEDISQYDLSQIKVDQLSDSQIEALLSRAEKEGLTQEQMESMAMQRGMPASEVSKLRKRIEKLKYKNSTKSDKDKLTDRSRNATDKDEKGDNLSQNKAVQDRIEKDATEKDATETDLFGVFDEAVKERPEDKIFGFSLFNRKKLTFEPILNIATPQNYVLGPDDEVIIEIWGASQETYQQKITPDGTIFIDNLGVIALNGFTIEEATGKLRKSLSKIYAGLNSGNTFLKVTLGSVRSIKVNIVGDVYRPGTYTLPSLATVFNALYAAGGPSVNGTLRSVKIIRNNKVIANLDLYDFLLKGEQKNNIRIQDQDVIFISPYQNRVELKGEIKRPYFYDMQPDETLSDLISFSGGFTGKAYNQRIKINRKTGKEQKIFDVDVKNADSLLMANGDEIVVDSVINRFENRVEIKGAVYRPGFFAIDGTLSLKELIQKAEGLRGDAFKGRASVYRTREDYTIEVIPVDIALVFSGNRDINLQREDLVIIPSIFDLKEEYFVSVEGEVRKPGDYLYVANSTVEDVILQAGGLLESASLARVEVARRVRNKTATTTSVNIAEVFQFQITDNLGLSGEAKLFTLEPFDQVFVRRSPGYESQSVITLEGEILFPGKYSLTNKNERISDIIARSGGLTPEAFPKGAKLVRKLPVDAKARQKALETIRSQSRDSIKFTVELDSISAIGINLDRILTNPKSKYDIILQDGDVIKVPKELQTVRLSGQVLSPVLVRFDHGKSFKGYVSGAGGFAPDAKKSKSYIIYANGTMDRTRKIFFFNSFPKVEPGAEIIVPKKPERDRMSSGEAIALGSGLSSMALIIVTIIGAFK